MGDQPETPSDPVQPDSEPTEQPVPQPTEEPPVTPETVPTHHEVGPSGEPAPGTVTPASEQTQFTEEEYNSATDDPPEDHHQQSDEDPPDLEPEGA